jgi:outer membrane protein TolC
MRAAGKRLAILILLVAVATISAGCTRRYYRNGADKQVDSILTEKNVYPDWSIEQWHAYPDGRARFADPSDPDHPPKPCDDPAAEHLGPNPQKAGKAGSGGWEGTGYLQMLADWDFANRTAQQNEELGVRSGEKNPADAPHPTPLVPQIPSGVGCDMRTTDKPFLITLDQSVELGVINSREFQDRREDLYLIALPVALQRFSFTAQFLAAGETLRQWAGNESNAGRQNNWSITSNTGVSKLFSTGALLLLNFANQTVIDFTKFPRTVSESTASLDLIQPLLQGGGKAVTLEPLTQAERSLLYEIRGYARFRKEFFVSIAGGGGGSITGGVFVPSGVVSLSTVSPGSTLGSSGLFPGQIPVVQTSGSSLRVTPGESGTLNLNPAIPPSAAGYLGTLLQYAQIGIDQENIEALERFIKLFQALKEGGDLSQLQVDQVEQQLLQGKSSKLSDEQQYGNAIDQFKIQLGLPTALPIELEDSPLRPMTRQFRRYEQVFRQFDEVTQTSANLGGTAPNQLRSELRRLVQEAALTRGTVFQREFPAKWAAAEILTADQLTARRRRVAEERRALLDRRADLERVGKVLPPADESRLAQLDADDDIADFEQMLRDYESQPWAAQADAARRREAQTVRFRIVINAYDLLLGQARNERLAALRTTWPPLPRLCVAGDDLLAVPEEDAFATASRTTVANRFDLMNARGQLTDAWRQIAVFANSLLGTLNVRYHLGENSPIGAARPFALGGSRYEHDLIIDYQLPLVRQAEQNNYRASLIAYQRQRRAMMEAEDLAVQTVRGEIRQLRVLAENYRIQQRQVELAYLTVENSLDTLKAPPGAAPAGTVAQAGQSTAAQAAALTTQLLNAQSRVPAAQNALLSVWISYLNSRLQLYRDLELMPLDARGAWIDEAASLCDGSPALAPVPTEGGRPGPAPTQPVERLPSPGDTGPPREGRSP